MIKVPHPINETVLSYGPGTKEKAEIKAVFRELKSKQIEIPLCIGGKEVKTNKLADCRMPHNHKHILGRYHKGGAKEVAKAAQAARKARVDWTAMPWHARAAIFLKAADLLAGPYRKVLNGATMLCQSKTAFQAEIDSACELIDFLRFNVHFAEKVYEEQPISSRFIWNYMQQRPLEGYVFAVTPFNFTSIAGNLPTAPAIMGNTVVWKPASSAVYTAHYLMQLFKAAGLPDGVINMVPGSGGEVGTPAIVHPEFAGVHFTGSTEVFQGMWNIIGSNIKKYKSYPRIVGETGGKDFIFVHPSADIEEVATAMVRGAFEYQGQKCSAASRAYVPKSMWPKLKQMLVDQISQIKMGDVEDFTNFMNAVIDKAAFNTIKGYIDFTKSSAKSRAKILCGGGCDDSKGYFIEPTVIEAFDPHFKTMEEEIFGPVFTVYTYQDKRYKETLRLCDKSSPYALTGAIFARDRKAIEQANDILMNAAGNFYINDKPTGAVVGQQPFGGARASGTNDKAGSMINLMRWVSPRTIKESFVSPTDFKYPFMQEP
ncbi:L-glutamate gamma-semialdehyde dehydrogenase [Elusimicrobiota bacterium]